MPTFELRFANGNATLWSMGEQVNIHRFTDYRAFLMAHVQDMKRSKQSWSLGSWTKRLGLKTTSSISKIIQGTRDPGPEITEKLIHYFRFNDRQAYYFRDLVRLHKIRRDPRLSVLLMEKMQKQHPDGRIRILDDKTFMVISNWYYFPLRELCRSGTFQEDADWIAKRFLFKITPRDIRQAIETMIGLDLLRRDKNGFLEVAEGLLDTSNEVASEALKRYHEQMLSHAAAAVRSIPVNEREITSTTLLMKSSNLAQAKELIRKFKKDFERLFEETDGDRVYQIQIQLFPLTEKFTEGGQNNEN